MIDPGWLKVGACLPARSRQVTGEDEGRPFLKVTPLGAAHARLRALGESFSRRPPPRAEGCDWPPASGPRENTFAGEVSAKRSIVSTGPFSPQQEALESACSLYQKLGNTSSLHRNPEFCNCATPITSNAIAKYSTSASDVGEQRLWTLRHETLD